jgi:predicted DNA-binding transcriptional regulator AlpA
MPMKHPIDNADLPQRAVPSLDAIAELPVAELPSLVLALAAAQSAVAARLADTAAMPRDDAYLSVDEVAAQLGVDPAWVYRQAARWPFAVKLSSKVVRIERAGLRRWLTQRRRR